MIDRSSQARPVLAHHFQKLGLLLAVVGVQGEAFGETGRVLDKLPKRVENVLFKFFAGEQGDIFELPVLLPELAVCLLQAALAVRDTLLVVCDALLELLDLPHEAADQLLGGAGSLLLLLLADELPVGVDSVAGLCNTRIVVSAILLPFRPLALLAAYLGAEVEQLGLVVKVVRHCVHDLQKGDVPAFALEIDLQDKLFVVWCLVELLEDHVVGLHAGLDPAGTLEAAVLLEIALLVELFVRREDPIASAHLKNAVKHFVALSNYDFVAFLILLE